MARAWTAVLLGLLTLLLSADAQAHGFVPSVLVLRERAPSLIELRWREAPSAAGRGIAPVVPPGCQDERAEPDATGAGLRLLRCAAGLSGATLSVRGLVASGDEVLVRVDLLDGQTLSAVLRPDAPALTVPARAATGAVLRNYVALGLSHIAGGYDHLLFVLLLLLLLNAQGAPQGAPAGRLPAARRLLATITAFTLAHSLTLALAVLGLVTVPAPPVEAAIALSLAVLAAEVCRAGPSSIGATRPWTLAFGFGLLHGLGFAGALSETGLPPGAVPRALLGFNLGVELGQLAFVALLLLVGRALRAIPPLDPRAPGPRRVLAYGIGTLAALWCWQRVAAF